MDHHQCQRQLRSDLPSSDPVDTRFVDLDYRNQSTFRMYTWNFLDGPGRVDSGVDSH